MRLRRLSTCIANPFAALTLLALGCGSERTEEPTHTLTQKATTVTPGANVNVTRAAGNQAEQAITVDPTNPNRLFVGTNSDGNGVFAAFSNDGGNTWLSSAGAGDTAPGDFHLGNADDTLTDACCDPTAAWDRFGNLFFGYLGDGTRPSVVTLSVDGGATFNDLAQLGTGTDQPTVVIGPGLNGNDSSIWVLYDDSGQQVQGATVTGLGAANIGAFSAAQAAPVGQFGDIAIGPNGQVMVAGQIGGGSSGGTIQISTDPDGFGPLLFGAVTSFATDVGTFDIIPAQPTSGSPASAFGIDAEVGLAYDRSNGPFRGRAYAVYTIEVPDESNDTDIVLRFSDDDGANWSNEIRVNDDTTTNSQFLPRIAVDQTTGFVAVSFHDARNDDGLGGAGDTNGIANDDAQYFLAVSLNGGQTFLPNVQVSAGTSDNVGNDPPAPGLRDIDYGDYSGLAFESGVVHPAWADNSNSTGDNPDGTLSRFDVYTAAVAVHANEPPVAVCADVTISADGVCSASVTLDDIDAGSFDPDDPPPTCTVSSTGPFGPGAHTVTLTCVDAEGASDSCTSTVTVVDDIPPVFTVVPPDITTSTCGSLDIGTAEATDNCDTSVTVTNNAPAQFPPGTTVVTWTAVDDAGNIETATQRVTVILTDNPACCPAGTNVIVGTSNNDTLTGTNGSDCILGLGAQDTINGLGGNDFISGGEGNDTINGGDGSDALFGGSAQDTVTGGSGNDSLFGGDGDDNLQGGIGDDTISGGQGQDQVLGQDGNDTLAGDDGDDNLQGGNGNDALNGGANNDQCNGGAGTNTFAQCEFGAPNSCANGVQDPGETDVDCGGSCVANCPAGGGCVTGADCQSGLCSGGICQGGGGSSSVVTTLSFTTDWGGGYCAVLNVTNNSASSTSSFTVNLNTNASTIYTSWNGTFSGSSGAVTVTPCCSWNASLSPGETDSSIGFCANRSTPGSGTLPIVVSSSGS